MVKGCDQGVGLGTKFEQRGEELGSLFVAGLYTALECVPRHTVEPGEAASAREKAITASCCPPAHEEDEDELLLVNFYEGLCWAGLGRAGLTVLGCLMGYTAR
jgi:hypothetical protein